MSTRDENVCALAVYSNAEDAFSDKCSKAITAFFREVSPCEDRRYKVLAFISDGDLKEAISNKRHDVVNSLRQIEIICKKLKAGYRFEDERAMERIEALEAALSTLSDGLMEIY